MNKIEYNPIPHKIRGGKLETTVLKQSGDYFIIECDDNRQALQRQKNILFAHSRIKNRKTTPADFDIRTELDGNNVKVIRK